MQINEMKDGLGNREVELKFLQEQLMEATRERDRERAANLKIKVHLHVLWLHHWWVLIRMISLMLKKGNKQR